MPEWTAKATGDMTLSLLDEDGTQILAIDMLSYNTMKAGTEGSLLTRALNDLNIIANFTQQDYDLGDDNLMFPGDGYSPLPWSLSYDEKKRRILIRNGNNKKLAEKAYPKSVPDAKIMAYRKTIEEGLAIINSTNIPAS